VQLVAHHTLNVGVLGSSPSAAAPFPFRLATPTLPRHIPA